MYLLYHGRRGGAGVLPAVPCDFESKPGRCGYFCCTTPLLLRPHSNQKCWVAGEVEIDRIVCKTNPCRGMAQRTIKRPPPAARSFGTVAPHQASTLVERTSPPIHSRSLDCTRAVCLLHLHVVSRLLAITSRTAGSSHFSTFPHFLR